MSIGVEPGRSSSRRSELQLLGVVLRLPDAFGQRLIPCLGFDHSELVVAISGRSRQCRAACAPPVPFDASGRDDSRRTRLPSTTPQPAAFSAGSMCSALVSASFIAFTFYRLPENAWCSSDFFNASSASSFRAIDDLEALGFFVESVERSHDNVS